MRKMVPDAKVVVVRRKTEDVEASLQKFGIALSPEKLQAEISRLEEISSAKGTLTVTFAELNTVRGCKKVFEHCLGVPFDREWWASLKDKNIQVDIRESISTELAHRKFIENMHTQAEEILRPSIQSESWEVFFRDGQKIIAEHIAEVQRPDEDRLDPDYETAALLYGRGCLQVTTARVSGELVGYVVCIIGRDPEYKTQLRGTQIPIFVRKEYRGHTGLRLHAFMRKSLREKNVKRLTMRSGVRGVGQRQDILFRRLGAKEDGHMFTLDLSI